MEVKVEFESLKKYGQLLSNAVHIRDDLRLDDEYLLRKKAAKCQLYKIFMHKLSEEIKEIRSYTEFNHVELDSILHSNSYDNCELKKHFEYKSPYWREIFFDFDSNIFEMLEEISPLCVLLNGETVSYDSSLRFVDRATAESLEYDAELAMELGDGDPYSIAEVCFLKDFRKSVNDYKLGKKTRVTEDLKDFIKYAEKTLFKGTFFTKELIEKYLYEILFLVDLWYQQYLTYMEYGYTNAYFQYTLAATPLIADYLNWRTRPQAINLSLGKYSSVFSMIDDSINILRSPSLINNINDCFAEDAFKESTLFFSGYYINDEEDVDIDYSHGYEMLSPCYELAKLVAERGILLLNSISEVPFLNTTLIEDFRNLKEQNFSIF